MAVSALLLELHPQAKIPQAQVVLVSLCGLYGAADGADFYSLSLATK
jgi:hypothetical protein